MARRRDRPEILVFPAPFPGADAFVGSRRVRAWKAPKAFEFHCPDRVDEEKVVEAASLRERRAAVLSRADSDIASAKSVVFAKNATEDKREGAEEALRELEKERKGAEIEFERKIEAAQSKAVVSHGGTVRGPAGAWVVEEDGSYFVVAEGECQTVSALRAALSDNPEALAAFDAKVR